MEANNKLFLDTNRRHLQSIKNGSLKNIDLPKFWVIMVKEFNPGYGSVDYTDFDQAARLVNEVYLRYDEQLKTIA